MTELHSFDNLSPVMKKILVLALLCFSVSGASLDSFLDAIAKVESSKNPKAVNKKESAFGLYQIRPGYFKDSGVNGKHSDVFKPEVARKVVLSYFRKHEPEALKKLDFETLARCHNGGCGWRKHKSATNVYWKKVQKNLK